MTDVHNDMLDDDDFDTILSSDIDFSGTLICDKPFLIRGSVSGQIISNDLLVIDEQAVVEANISSSQLIIKGKVKGNVTAIKRVEIAVMGTLIGNVNAPEVHMETGCTFNGQCTMINKTGSS